MYGSGIEVPAVAEDEVEGIEKRICDLSRLDVIQGVE